jgi:hypothetical protein
MRKTRTVVLGIATAILALWTTNEIHRIFPRHAHEIPAFDHFPPHCMMAVTRSAFIAYGTIQTSDYHKSVVCLAPWAEVVVLK